MITISIILFIRTLFLLYLFGNLFNNMNNELYKKFEYEALDWIKSLENYNEGPFKRKPSETEWCMGELYNHLIISGLHFHIKNARACIEKTNGDNKGSKTFKGIILFLIGGFPSVKIKSELNDKFPPEIPEKISEVKDKLYKLLKEMELLNRELILLSKEDLKYKVKHPVNGFLNAIEWYKQVEMHFRHHQKQKERIEDFLIH